MERITDYFSFFLEAINDNAWVRNEEVSFREIGEKEGYIRGTLYLHGGLELHVAEYVIINHKKPIAINPTTTFIDIHNTSFLTCLFAYHVSVPGYELRVASC